MKNMWFMALTVNQSSDAGTIEYGFYFRRFFFSGKLSSFAQAYSDKKSVYEPPLHKKMNTSLL